MQAFEAEFILPAFVYIGKGARGKYKGKDTALFWLKRESGELYHLFAFLIKTGKRPSYFEKLLKKIDVLENKEQFYENSKKPNAVALTAYCIEQYMGNSGKSLEHLGVNSLIKQIEEGEFQSFYNHHITAYKSLFNYNKNLSKSDLEALAQEPPFSWIFANLQLV